MRRLRGDSWNFVGSDKDLMLNLYSSFRKKGYQTLFPDQPEAVEQPIRSCPGWVQTTPQRPQRTVEADTRREDGYRC